MKYIKIIVVSSMLLLNACAPINTQFSCNETAGDKCLSIEEVNEMAEQLDRDAHRPAVACKTCKNDKPVIWFAPGK